MLAQYLNKMAKYSENYVTEPYKKIGGALETLTQCLQIVCDGDLISKPDRDDFVNKGLIIRSNGYNIISARGIEYLEQLNIIHC